MKIAIRHQLRFPVGTGTARAVEHVLLTPLSGPTQTVREWSIDLPGIETAARFVDAFGNRAILANQTKPEGDLVFSVSGVVETIDRNGVVGRVVGEPVVALYRRSTALTAPDPAFVAEFAGADRTGPARIALLHAIMEALGKRFRYSPVAATAAPLPDDTAPPAGMTQTMNGMTQSMGMAGTSQSMSAGEAAEADEPTVDEAHDDRAPLDAAGFAHAFIATARALDIPARYVTGYLAADEDQPAAFHAWCEAYDDALGWIGFDAALGYCPTDRHVRVAAGLDALYTQAVRMVPEGGGSTLLDLSVEAAAQ